MFESEYRKIGARVVYWRRIRCLSQEKLAEKSSISRGRLSEIEHGKGPSSLETLLLICSVLHITLGQLVSDI